MHVSSSSWHARIYKASTALPPKNSCSYWGKIAIFFFAVIVASLAIITALGMGLVFMIGAPIATLAQGSMPWHEALYLTAIGYGLVLFGLYAMSGFDALERPADRAVHVCLWPVRAVTRLLSPIWRPIHRALCKPVEFT